MIAPLPVLEPKIDESAESSLNKTLFHTDRQRLRVNVMFSRGLCSCPSAWRFRENVGSLRPISSGHKGKYTRRFVAFERCCRKCIL